MAVFHRHGSRRTETQCADCEQLGLAVSQGLRYLGFPGGTTGACPLPRGDIQVGHRRNVPVSGS
jgi:hypothetical protein